MARSRGTWKPGQSGNLKGRPKGTHTKTRVLSEWVHHNSDALLGRLTQLIFSEEVAPNVSAGLLKFAFEFGCVKEGQAVMEDMNTALTSEELENASTEFLEQRLSSINTERSQTLSSLSDIIEDMPQHELKPILQQHKIKLLPLLFEEKMTKKSKLSDKIDLTLKN